jgi:hypothetical protein
MVATVRIDPEFTVVDRRMLLRGGAYLRSALFAPYDVSPTGDRFVMLKIGTDAVAPKLVWVQNFFAQLEGLAPTR